MSLLLSIGVILVSSVAIYFAGKYFANASSAIGDYLRIPRDVKGATFDAISSSMPELLVALYSVIIFKKFEVGIGTIAGSALFNLLIIPGICVFLAPVAFKIGRRVISRDALFYMFAVFALIVLIIYFKKWGLIISLVLLGAYLVYVLQIAKDTKKYRKRNKVKRKETNISKQILIFIITLGIIGLFTYFLTGNSIALAEVLGVSPIIIAFTITAAATSIPDTVISAVNARKGDIDDATSNIFGSNIFDIFVGLGLPLLIYSLIKGSVQIVFNNLEILLGLMFATMLSIYFFMNNNNILNKRGGVILLFMYFLFVAYVILLSIGIF